MTKQEKIMNGLECCLPAHDPDCDMCPYDSIDLRCRAQLRDDVFALMKAQEPRVMTLEELISNISASAWMETWNGALYEGWVLIYDRQMNGISIMVRIGITQPNGHVSWLKEMDYGKTWRCWTSRPTDEQREATPWQ